MESLKLKLVHMDGAGYYVSKRIEFWGATTDGNVFDGFVTVEGPSSMIRDFTIDFPDGNSIHMRELINCDEKCNWVTEYKKDGKWVTHPYYPPFSYLPKE